MMLTIPDPALVLLVGPSGSGKSTFAAAHFRPTEILSSDAIRAALADDAADQDASVEAFRVLAILANGRLKRRLTAVIDATNLRASDRKRYSAVAARYGIPTVAIAFDFPPAIYETHNQSRPDRVVDGDVVAYQASRMRATVGDLPYEDYALLQVLRNPGDVRDVVMERRTSPIADRQRLL